MTKKITYLDESVRNRGAKNYRYVNLSNVRIGYNKVFEQMIKFIYIHF